MRRVVRLTRSDSAIFGSGRPWAQGDVTHRQVHPASFRLLVIPAPPRIMRSLAGPGARAPSGGEPMRVRLAGLATMLLLVSCSENTEPSAVETGKSPKFILAASPVKDRYIVVLRDERASAATVDDVAKD